MGGYICKVLRPRCISIWEGQPWYLTHGSICTFLDKATLDRALADRWSLLFIVISCVAIPIASIRKKVSLRQAHCSAACLLVHCFGYIFSLLKLVERFCGASLVARSAE